MHCLDVACKVFIPGEFFATCGTVPGLPSVVSQMLLHCPSSLKGPSTVGAGIWRTAKILSTGRLWWQEPARVKYSSAVTNNHQNGSTQAWTNSERADTASLVLQTQVSVHYITVCCVRSWKTAGDHSSFTFKSDTQPIWLHHLTNLTAVILSTTDSFNFCSLMNSHHIRAVPFFQVHSGPTHTAWKRCCHPRVVVSHYRSTSDTGTL